MLHLNDTLSFRVCQIAENCWKGSGGIVSSAQSLSIVFKHRFSLVSIAKIAENAKC